MNGARLWHGKARPVEMKKTIVWGPNITSRDIIELENLKIGYICKATQNAAPLLKLIGTLDAESVIQGQKRLVQGRESANSIFKNTVASFDLFGSNKVFDAAFYSGLGREFSEQIEKTPLFLLIDAIAENQDTTIQHCSLVTTVAVAFGGALGLSSKEISRIFTAAFFHDIGKAAIPKAIIDKPGRLTDDEMRLMRTHATVGCEMLRRFPETAGETADVALYHHEMLDGSGYPQGLKGAEISDLIRIITICDIFSALIERRAYKPPLPPEQAYDILMSMRGKLDGDLLSLFEPVAAAVSNPVF